MTAICFSEKQSAEIRALAIEILKGEGESAAHIAKAGAFARVHDMNGWTHESFASSALEEELDEKKVELCGYLLGAVEEELEATT